MHQRAEQAEAAEDERRAQREPDPEGGGGQGESSPSVMTSGTHGADHGEASGRPGAGEADEQSRQRERDGQHLIFVS